MKTKFQELAEALDKALHHAYCQGRLIERSDDKAAEDQQQKCFEERNKVVKFLRETLLEKS